MGALLLESCRIICDGVVADILGVWKLALEKLDPARGSGIGKRSLFSPSRICKSMRRELVAVADLRRKAIVLSNKYSSIERSTN